MSNIQPALLVCFYAPEDASLYAELERHLVPLQRQGVVQLWQEGYIVAGTDRQHEIEAQLEKAEILLLLLSAAFVASDFYERLVQQSGRCVVPVLLRTMDRQGDPLANLKILPSNGRPVMAWPDRDEAWTDVTRGLREAIATWQHRRPTPRDGARPWHVPYQRNPFFVGRHEALRTLREALSRNHAAALTQAQAVSGLGGIGKTQTAVEYAYRYQEEYSAVFFLRADSALSIRTGFPEIAAVLGLPERDAKDPEEAIGAVHRWLGAHPGWLLIFDNADQPELVKPFCPRQAVGHILLTSRAQDCQVMGIVNPVELREVPPEEALEFLLCRTGRSQLVEKEEQAVRSLAAELGYLPLALEQAGAYIKAKQARFADYLASYRKRHLMVLEQHGPVLGDHPESVATTWSMNFLEVEAASAAAADLLRISALLGPDDIPLELITKGAPEMGPTIGLALAEVAEDPLVLDALLEPLLRYSLIRRDIEARTYSIHRLVQEVLKARMDRDMERIWAECAIRAVDRAFPDGKYENWALCQRLFLHARAVTKLVQVTDSMTRGTGRLLNQIGLYLNGCAQYDEAEVYLQRALEIREKELGPDHPDVAKSSNDLAMVYRRRCRFDEAERLARRALEILEGQLGPGHLDVANPLISLAALHFDRCQYTEAEPLCRRALGIREKELGPGHPFVATSLNNLAALYHVQGRYDEAEPLYRRALEIREMALGPDHPDVSLSLHNLAALYDAQDQPAKAEPLYKRALEIGEMTLDPGHPYVARCRKNYAALLREIGREAEAAVLENKPG